MHDSWRIVLTGMSDHQELKMRSGVFIVGYIVLLC